MSGNTRILNSGPRAFFREHVTVANATGLHLDPHLSYTRLRNLALDDLEICSGLRDLCHLHWCHLWCYRYSHCCHKSSYRSSKEGGVSHEPEFEAVIGHLDRAHLRELTDGTRQGFDLVVRHPRQARNEGGRPALLVTGEHFRLPGADLAGEERHTDDAEG